MKRNPPLREDKEIGMSEATEAVQVAMVHARARLDERKLIEEGIDRRQKLGFEHETALLKMKHSKDKETPIQT